MGTGNKHKGLRQETGLLARWCFQCEKVSEFGLFPSWTLTPVWVSLSPRKVNFITLLGATLLDRRSFGLSLSFASFLHFTSFSDRAAGLQFRGFFVLSLLVPC